MKKAGRQGRGGLAPRGERFTFLVDTSGSMRKGGVADKFADIHGEFLDGLSAEHPDAWVRLVAFDEYPAEQYGFTPIADAPTLTMKAKYGTDLPTAILEGIGIESLGKGDTTVIITDGDMLPHNSRRHKVADARKAILWAKHRGAKFLFLITTRSFEEGIEQAALIGLGPEEVMVWEHSAEGLRESLSEAGHALMLGPSRRG